MQIIKISSVYLLLSPNVRSVSAAAVGHTIPPLAGAVPAAESDASRELASVLNGAVAADHTGYTYQLRITGALPLKLQNNGDPELERCVEWVGDANGANFTWYGLRIQLPDDAATGGGGWTPAATRATKELGFVQDYNDTYNLLDFNFTTQESQPIVRINFDDDPFWDTYKFDFVEQGAVVADDADYQEFKVYGSVSCYATPASEQSRTVLWPVRPTLTTSLKKFESGRDVPLPIPDPPSAASLHRSVTMFGLSLSTFAAVWISAS